MYSLCVLKFLSLTSSLPVTNTFYAAYLPISTYVSFDNTGLPYDPTAIVTNGTFDAAKYEAYSPLFMPTNLTLAYGIALAAFTSLIVHTFRKPFAFILLRIFLTNISLVWFRRDIARRFRSTLKDERDVHSRLMMAYPEVPHWWYACICLISVLFTFTAISIVPTGLPIWAAIIGMVLAAVMALPVGMIQAITNQQIGLNVFYEMIAGYMLPGRPVANMIFKSIGYTGTGQALAFAGDLKLGHYMKVPPRMMFSVQVVAQLVGSFCVMCTQWWMITNIEDICTPTQASGFVCSSTNAFASASLIWGGIGPRRIFGAGSM